MGCKKCGAKDFIKSGIEKITLPLKSGCTVRELKDKVLAYCKDPANKGWLASGGFHELYCSRGCGSTPMCKGTKTEADTCSECGAKPWREDMVTMYLNTKVKNYFSKLCNATPACRFGKEYNRNGNCPLTEGKSSTDEFCATCECSGVVTEVIPIYYCHRLYWE